MRVYAPAIAILLVAVSAHGTTIFTDRTEFETFVADFTIVTTEDFESAELVGSGSSGAVASRTFSDFSLWAEAPAVGADAVKVLDFVFYGTGNTTPGGQRFVYIDSDVGFQSTLTTIIFESEIDAFGFDYSGLSQPGASPTVTIAGQDYPLALNPYPPTNPRRVDDELFWGFIGDAPFSTLVIDSGGDSAYGIDQVTYASAPEPGTAILLALGLGLLASRAPMRRAR